MNPEQQRIADRIRKLFAMAGSANEHEALAFAAKAQALLIEHGMSRAQVEKNPGKYVTMATPQMPEKAWEALIFTAASALNFCQVAAIQVADNECVYLLYGKALNIDVSVQTAKYLMEAVERAADAPLYKLAEEESPGFMDSFRIACAARINERVAVILAAANAGVLAAANGTNLPATIGDSLEVQAAFKEQFKDSLKTTKHSHAGQAMAVDAGRAAADMVGLNRQLNEAKVRAMLAEADMES